MDFQYDAFICHASEDKDDLVRPLAAALIDAGCKIWYDEMTIKIGDSLRRKIEEGLASSRYGIVVLSPDFFGKEWPQYELDGLVAREMADAVKVILPVWHKVDAALVRKYSLPLSMRYGGRTSDGVDKLAQDLVEIIKPGEVIRVLEVDDDLSRAKNTILRLAFESNNQIMIQPATMGRRECVVIGRMAFNDSEEFRKLFQFALGELVRGNLIELLSANVAELTYLGIQAAKRLPPIDQTDIPEK